MSSNEITFFFNDFENVLENKQKYNIEWAFKDAQDKLNTFQNDYIDTKLKKQCTLCKQPMKINKDFKIFTQSSSKLVKKQKYQSQLFTNMFTLMTIIEFILSILLVLVISEISHTGEGMVESEILGIWIVTTFAFLKVFIERYYVKPRVEAFGWKLYSRSITSLKSLTLEFNNQITENISSSKTNIPTHKLPQSGIYEVA